MKIKVDFTLEIHPDSMEAPRYLYPHAESASGLRAAVQGEAEEAPWSYLEGNGVNTRRVRSVYGPSDYAEGVRVQYS